MREYDPPRRLALPTESDRGERDSTPPPRLASQSTGPGPTHPVALTMKLLIATLLLTAGVASATQFCCYKQITNEMDANLCLAEDQSDFDCPAIAAWVR